MAPPVLLLWGEQPYLLRLAAFESLGALEPVVVDGDRWEPGATADLATPSLLGGSRALLVTEAQGLTTDALSEIGRYASSPSPDARLVLVWVVGQRAKGPPKKITGILGPESEVRRVLLDRKELPKWLLDRARAIGLRATQAGASALVQTLGEDPAELDRALEQLAGSHATEGLTPATVAAQFRGLGDRRIWELTDAAFAGDRSGALRTLVALLEGGDEPLAILGGIASRLRDLIRIRSLPPRTPTAQMARAAGLRFEWQARRFAEHARRYDEGELEAIHTQLAEADRLLKQGGTGDVVLPAVVAAIAAPPSEGRGAAGRMRALRGAGG
jgi:DNA polymerase-3 subunit delta